MAPHANQARALSFNTVATQYAAARPGYPPALFDAVEELAGRALVGADVLDCGAGTGIATRLLRERGARVVALEPGAGMAAELRRAEPEVPLVRGEGNHLPFAASGTMNEKVDLEGMDCGGKARPEGPVGARSAATGSHGSVRCGHEFGVSGT